MRRKRTEIQQQVIDLIEFYEARGWDWTAAAEFELAEHSGLVEHTLHPPNRWNVAGVGRPRKNRVMSEPEQTM